MLGDERTQIPYAAFAGTNIKVIDIPDSVTSIVYRAFSGCEDLSDISIPEGIIDIGGHTFDNTAWYNNHKDGVMYLDHAVYSWKGAMAEDTSVTIKNGTTILADYAFEEQRNLAEITLPESLMYIGDYAFYGCDSLETINIPENVCYIGEYAFLGCKSLKEIIVDPDNEYFYVENGRLCSVDGYTVYDINKEYVVSDVWFSSRPNKYSYKIGEEIDLTGAKIIVLYTNGYREYITDDFEKYGIEIEGFDSSVAGDIRVALLYNGELYTYLWLYISGDSDLVAGDVNGDGDVNAKDANIMKRIIAGEVNAIPGSDMFIVSDLNDDNDINAKDANILKRMISGDI